MNILYAIIAILALIGLIWLGFYFQRLIDKIKRKGSERTDEDSLLLIGSKFGRGTAWTVAAVLVIVLTNNFFIKIPNPFELKSASFDGLSSGSGEVSTKQAPLVIPPTNADPSVAEQNEKDLLTRAKQEQAQSLNK